MQLAPFKLERYFAQYEFSTPFLLCSSDCESVTIRDLLALEPETHELFQQQWLVPNNQDIVRCFSLNF